MVDKEKNVKHRPGKINLRGKPSSMEDILAIAKDNEIIQFKKSTYPIVDQYIIQKELTFTHGKRNQQQVLIDTRIKRDKPFNESGFLLAGHKPVLFTQFNIKLGQEMIAIDTQKDYSGDITFNQVDLRYQRQYFTKAVPTYYPAIRIYGKGKVIINQSYLESIYIDAPDRDVIIDHSQLGNFYTASYIKAKSITIQTSTINNTQLETANGKFFQLTTNGGLGLNGHFKGQETYLHPIPYQSMTNLPEIMTYIVTSPHTVLDIDKISSEEKTDKPFYRHFQFNQSKIRISNGQLLKPQVLKNIINHSKFYGDKDILGDQLIDPTNEDILFDNQQIKQYLKE